MRAIRKDGATDRRTSAPSRFVGERTPVELKAGQQRVSDALDAALHPAKSAIG